MLASVNNITIFFVRKGNMYIKRIFVCVLGCFFFNSCTQSPLQELAKEETQDIGPAEIITFLQEHQHDSDWCNAISLTFKVRHDESYDTNKWNEIVIQFLHLALLCQQNEKNPEDTQWLDPLGQPFKEVRDFALKEGIHGDISISVDHGTIQFDGLVRRDDSYDELAWQNIIDKLIIYTEQFEKHRNNDDIPWIQQCCPIIGKAISLSGDDSGIHGIIDIRWYDKDNYAYLNYSE